ncbi:MAG: CotH kinase family protein, partial [Oscillospiraceae bacterium]|nr:CotH kinase family protein [Oscillospiraceae bacterium]
MFFWISGDKSGEEYPIKIFGRDVINIEITADENDWNEMLQNKMSKPYIPCDLKIDGHEFKEVGLRPKGNSSLTSIQGDRISYRLDFDHYIDNQTCYGLEKMVLNNLQADATYMKDFIAYDLMEYEGVNAPLHTYAFITLNGSPFGVYLAVEVYDEDYLSRVYDDTTIKLYNVKTSGLDEFESAVVDPESGTVIESHGIEEAIGMGGPPPPPGGPGEMPPGGPGGMPPSGPGGMLSGGLGEMFPGDPPPPPGGEQGGGDLVYIDDSTSSYTSIFANTVSKNANAKDFAKVIRAIKYLNKENVTNEELEEYWDVDAALRYLAVHAFMVNGDSYTGHMKQNYYLAEKNGKIIILPWDYNLSFGSFGGGPGGGPPGAPQRDNKADGPGVSSVANETTKIINHAIDTPTIGVDMESRPLVSVLLSRNEYKERYHRYLDELTEYASGDFINKLETVEDAIYPYIERETISFFTPEEQTEAFRVLKKFLRLRCQSIQGQLKGNIPSETDLQTGADLITADFSVNDMGTMGGPGGPPPGGDMQGGMPPPPPGMPGGDMRGG